VAGLHWLFCIIRSVSDWSAAGDCRALSDGRRRIELIAAGASGGHVFNGTLQHCFEDRNWPTDTSTGTLDWWSVRAATLPSNTRAETTTPVACHGNCRRPDFASEGANLFRGRAVLDACRDRRGM
jgi:hypothetical protein